MGIKKIVIKGNEKINGKVRVSGAKNSVLKLICASILLKKGTLTLNNVPNLSDVITLLGLINTIGGKITLNGDLSKENDGKTLIIDPTKINKFTAPYETVSQMRATFIVLGPLLARFGQAKVSLPGGCAIGTRALDIHFDALKQMGVDIQIDDGYVIAKAKNGKIQGADIKFRFASVGATENIMLSATLAEGITRIENPAKEPEIIDLANCLNKMGAKITGAGTPLIEIEGVKELHSAEYTVMGDRIEAGSFMIGALLTGGELEISGINFDVLENFTDELKKMNADIKRIDKTTLKIKRKKTSLKATNIITGPHPEFPTDLQSPVMALLAGINGDSTIDETVFENRFMHVAELVRMNADIQVMGNKAIIEGHNGCYKGAEVMATDLRAGMALILAGIAGNGETEVRRYYHVERGYEFIDRKLQKCGVDVKILYEKKD
ncbi:MAG: UDP-N-acetylglucosamine 1-carboxyvinyltransferase [Rickettsiales bacterium]|jgi:UDP-N-acetylglucosamine 1-carboxyvinyltransferase|nr:UDP-N-acetylglucosamine 1-carboxyvinyltransferase [Rickettsiales bacterium]